MLSTCISKRTNTNLLLSLLDVTCITYCFAAGFSFLFFWVCFSFFLFFYSVLFWFAFFKTISISFLVWLFPLYCNIAHQSIFLNENFEHQLNQTSIKRTHLDFLNCVSENWLDTYTVGSGHPVQIFSFSYTAFNCKFHVRKSWRIVQSHISFTHSNFQAHLPTTQCTIRAQKTLVNEFQLPFWTSSSQIFSVLLST